MLPEEKKLKGTPPLGQVSRSTVNGAMLIRETAVSIRSLGRRPNPLQVRILHVRRHLLRETCLGIGEDNHCQFHLLIPISVSHLKSPCLLY